MTNVNVQIPMTNEKNHSPITTHSSSVPLQHHGSCHSASGADADQSKLGIPPLHLVGQRRQDPAAGGGPWMPYRRIQNTSFRRLYAATSPPGREEPLVAPVRVSRKGRLMRLPER